METTKGRMEGPLAKQNPTAPNRYSIRTFVLDGSGLRFRGARREDGEAAVEHRIGMDEIHSLCPGNGDAAATAGAKSDAATVSEGTDFQIRLKRDGGLCLQLRARSREEAFRWLLALSEASGVSVDLPSIAARSSDPLPTGWEAVLVEETRQHYYRNIKTTQRQWVPPTSRGVIRSARQSNTDATNRLSAGKAAADAARLDAELREMKAARRRRKRGGISSGSEAPAVKVSPSMPPDESNNGETVLLQPELSRRGLELQASIAELTSRRQARRQRRRDDRKRVLWNAGAVENDQRSGPSELATQQSVPEGTSDLEFASLSSEERVAVRMAQLLQAAFPNEDAHSRVCSQISGSHDTMARRRQMAKEVDGFASHSHPEAPVPTFAEPGAFVSAAIVDAPARADTTRTSKKADELEQQNDPAARLLRAELERLRPSELRRRALRAHIPASLIGEAQDSGDPKSNLIALLVQYEMDPIAADGSQMSAAAAHAPDETKESTRDLDALRPSELRRRALALGIERSKLDEAQDSVHPKQAIIQLILIEQRMQAEQRAVDEQKTQALIEGAKADVHAAQEELRKTQDAAAGAEQQLSSLRETHAHEAHRREHAELRVREIELELAETRSAAATELTSEVKAAAAKAEMVAREQLESERQRAEIEIRQAKVAAEKAASELEAAQTLNVERTASAHEKDSAQVKSAQAEAEAETLRLQVSELKSQLRYAQHHVPAGNGPSSDGAGPHQELLPPPHGVSPPPQDGVAPPIAPPPPLPPPPPPHDGVSTLRAPPPNPNDVGPPAAPPPPPVAKPSGSRGELMSEISAGTSLRHVDRTLRDEVGGRDQLMLALNSGTAAKNLKHVSSLHKSGPIPPTTDGIPAGDPAAPLKSTRELMKARRQMKRKNAQSRTDKPTGATTGVQVSPENDSADQTTLPVNGNEIEQSSVPTPAPEPASRPPDKEDASSAKPPPGLSATERMEWKRKQKQLNRK